VFSIRDAGCVYARAAKERALVRAFAIQLVFQAVWALGIQVWALEIQVARALAKERALVWPFGIQLVFGLGIRDSGLGVRDSGRALDWA